MVQLQCLVLILCKAAEKHCLLVYMQQHNICAPIFFIKHITQRFYIQKQMVLYQHKEAIK